MKFRGNRQKTTLTKMVVSVSVAGLFVASIATMALAAPGVVMTISIDTNTIVRANEGSITQVASVDVAAEAIGQKCTAVSQAQNPGSEHPNNDFLVDSGSSQIVIPDVEAVSGGSSNGIGVLDLGSQVTVSLRMGSDEVFSGGFDVILTCETVETTTTTTVETTTTIVAETTTTAEVIATTVTTTGETTSTSTPDEVLGTEVLPFTGAEANSTILVASVLGILGALLVIASRRAEN